MRFIINQITFLQESAETFLLWSIAIFTFFTVFCLVALIISRRLSKRNDRRRIELQPIVEEILFSVMFTATPIKELLKQDIYTANQHQFLFKKTLIKSCIKLRQQYSGELSDRLEEFYLTSNLKEYSVKKLYSDEWHIKCQGIRELSEMGQVDNSPAIILLCFSDNPLVKQTALTGVIKLKGISGLKGFQKFDQYLDDWTLANILYAVKKDLNEKQREIPDITFLLEHSNPSMKLLGLKLIGFLSLDGYQEDIQKLHQSANPDRVTSEAEKLIAEKI